MASMGGNLLQRVRCSYFRDAHSPCNKRDPGSGCSAIEGFSRGHAVLGTSEHCIAAHPSDAAVALAALDARVHTRSERGEHTYGTDDFFLTPGHTPHREHALEHGELVTAIEVPSAPVARRSLYLKVRDRAGYEFALVSVAAALSLVDGTIADVRLALGGVGTKPWRAHRAEGVLLGAPAQRENFASAARTELTDARPTSAQRLQGRARAERDRPCPATPSRRTEARHDGHAATAAIGAPLDRVDGHPKVTGTARYSADIAATDMAYACLVGARIASGRITRIDASAALEETGVLAVLTHENLPGIASQPPLAPSLAGGPAPGETFFPMQDDVVHYGGQYVALVVADTQERAQYAASLVRVIVRGVAVPSPPSSRAVTRRTNPRRSSRGSFRGVSNGAMRRRGSHRPVSGSTRRTPSPRTTTTRSSRRRRPHAGTATRSSSTTPRRASTPPSSPSPGCSVSRCRRSASRASTWAAVSAARPWSGTIRPLPRWRRARSADRSNWRSRGSRCSPRAVTGRSRSSSITLGATHEGRLTAIRHHKLSPTSHFDDWAEPSLNVAAQMYACQHYEGVYRLIRANTMTPTFMRAPGDATGMFALECAMDELAELLGVDPLELRLRNFADVDPVSGNPWSSNGLKECYERGAARFGWHDRDPAPRSRREGDWLIGTGMAAAAYPVTPPITPQRARARLYADGSVVVQAATPEFGTGVATVMAQVAADALACPSSAAGSRRATATSPISPPPSPPPGRA